MKLILQNFDMPNTTLTTAKQGDIIAVVPENHYGGVVTRKTHLIIKVDLGNVLTVSWHTKVFEMPIYDVDTLWFPNDETPRVLFKRRYRIPWNELITKAQAQGITVDMVKLLDETIDYQPLENTTFAITDLIQDKFLGKKLGTAEFNKIKAAIR